MSYKTYFISVLKGKVCSIIRQFKMKHQTYSHECMYSKLESYWLRFPRCWPQSHYSGICSIVIGIPSKAGKAILRLPSMGDKVLQQICVLRRESIGKDRKIVHLVKTRKCCKFSKIHKPAVGKWLNRALQRSAKKRKFR